MKIERVLDSITDLIVRCCDPEVVLLFGSYAKGQDNLESDIDLLVVGDFKESPYLRGSEVRQMLKRYPIRVDLHLITREEAIFKARMPHGFLRSVLENSIPLYQKQGEKGLFRNLCGW